MTFEEAEKIFKFWEEYVEINDKMIKVFRSIPKSFLPYPVEVLEEALNIMAKYYFENGDRRGAENIQGTMATLVYYKDDEEAIKDILESQKLKSPELRKLYIKNLKTACESWAKIKLS